MDKSILYQEKQPIYSWLIVLVFVACALGLIIPAAFGVRLDHQAMRPGEIMMVAILIVIWLFRKLIVVITPTQLTFGFPIWKKRLRLDTIVVGGVVTIPFLAGFGIHFCGKRMYVNAKMGRGVELTAKDRRYVIGSDSPEKLDNAIRSAVANWKGQ